MKSIKKQKKVKMENNDFGHQSKIINRLSFKNSGQSVEIWGKPAARSRPHKARASFSFTFFISF